MYRHRTLEAGLGRVEAANYAWSADSCEYAAVATVAVFAYKADRVMGPPPGRQKVGAKKLMDKLRGEYEVAESQSRADAGRDAKHATFAGCADEANYAGRADVAQYAWEVIGERKDTDKDERMEEAPWPRDARLHGQPRQSFISMQ